MPRYTVFKEMLLSVEVEADSPEEAREEMLDMDDNTFAVVECDHWVELDGDRVSD